MFSHYTQQSMDPTALFMNNAYDATTLDDTIDSLTMMSYQQNTLFDNNNAISHPYDDFINMDNQTSLDLYLTSSSNNNMLINPLQNNSSLRANHLQPLTNNAHIHLQSFPLHDDVSPSVDTSSSLLFKNTTSLNYLGFDDITTSDMNLEIPNVFDSGESRFSESNKDEEEEEMLLSPVYSPELDDIFGSSRPERLTDEEEPAVVCTENESQSTDKRPTVAASPSNFDEQAEDNDSHSVALNDDTGDDDDDDDDSIMSEEDSDSDWESNIKTKTKRTASVPTTTGTAEAAKSVHKKTPSNPVRSKRSNSLPSHLSQPTGDIKCSNCETTNTPLWRRNPDGNPLCNACGLFLKLHGKVRPLSLKTDVIKKRNRSSSGISSSNAGSPSRSRNLKKKSKNKKSGSKRQRSTTITSRGRTTIEAENRPAATAFFKKKPY